jgi:hypothetical protein
MSRIAAFVISSLGLAGTALAAPCQTTPTGAPRATGGGKGNAKAATSGLRRLQAERAAFLDAVTQLKACLGEKASEAKGWSISDVRYFDSDPIVEVDVVALLEGAPQVTVLGSGLPNTKKAQEAGGGLQQAKIEARRAAISNAQRNAKEALDAVLPKEGDAGRAYQELSGSLGACSLDDVAFWDDQAISVKLTCGRAAPAEKAPEEHPAPAVQKHEPATPDAAQKP